MKKFFITAIFLSFSLANAFAAEDQMPVRDWNEGRSMENGFGIVPMPYESLVKKGSPFTITNETVLVARTAETETSAAFLQERLGKSAGLTLRRTRSSNGNAIVLTVSDDATAFPEHDAYRLESGVEGIRISAKTERGLFYGVQSLLQLLPPAVYGDTLQDGLAMEVPALLINDKPSIDDIRGLHVDIARHFRTKEELFTIIDSMAMHKLNTLHLHLTDSEGWRVEISAYPRLTTVGAVGNYRNRGAPATFFTREDIREISAFAASRFISIIPEVDMPGHMGAAIRAYPQLNHPKDTGNRRLVIRDDAIGRNFAKAVLTEINDMFDSEYIHIGVDEINLGAKTPLYSSDEVVDFTRDITTFVKETLQKTPIVWDDAFTHGFEDRDTVVHWWRYGKTHWWRGMKEPIDVQLNQKLQPFILSPAYWTYFDMKNTAASGGARWAQPISPAEVYNWDPFGDMQGVHEGTRELVRGAIACTWSEHIVTMKDFGDRTYPRLAAFSERIWRGGKSEAPNILSWPDYRDQVLIPFQLKRYDALGLWYWSKDEPERLKLLPDARKQL